MKTLLQIIVKIGNEVNERVGHLSSWLTLLLVLLVCYNVFCRHVFEEADAWRGELEIYVFAFIFLLGAGYAFKHDRHVRVDLFYAGYRKRDKAWTNLIGGLVLLIPWCIIVLIYSWEVAQASLAINEKSPNPNGLPYRFILKFALSIGIAFLLLQAIVSIAKSILELTERPEEKKEVIR